MKSGSQRDICTALFIKKSFTIAKKRRKNPNIQTNELIKKMWYALAVEYYSAMKRKKTPSFATIQWMNLEDNTLSEISQTEVMCYHLGVELK